MRGEPFEVVVDDSYSMVPSRLIRGRSFTWVPALKVKLAVWCRCAHPYSRIMSMAGSRAEPACTLTAEGPPQDVTAVSRSEGCVCCFTPPRPRSRDFDGIPPYLRVRGMHAREKSDSAVRGFRLLRHAWLFVGL